MIKKNSKIAPEIKPGPFDRSLSIFFEMQCVKCELTVWVEAGGLREPPWDGSCGSCGTNAWTYLGQTQDKLKGLKAAAKDAGGKLVFRRRR